MEVLDTFFYHLHRVFVLQRTEFENDFFEMWCVQKVFTRWLPNFKKIGLSSPNLTFCYGNRRPGINKIPSIFQAPGIHARMEMACKYVVDPGRLEIRELNRHVSLSVLISKIPSRKERVEQFPMEEQNVFPIVSQIIRKGAKSLENCFSLNGLKRHSPDSYILVFEWPVEVGQNNHIFTKPHPVLVRFPVVIPWDDENFEAPAREDLT